MLCKQGGINFAFTKSFSIRKLLSLSHQVLGACFKPYKAFSSLKIKSEYVGPTNPGNYSAYTSSLLKSFKNAFLTSI